MFHLGVKVLLTWTKLFYVSFIDHFNKSCSTFIKFAHNLTLNSNTQNVDDGKHVYKLPVNLKANLNLEIFIFYGMKLKMQTDFKEN